MVKVNRDAMVLFGGAALVLALVTAAALFPVYQVGREYERHFVFDPPKIRVGNPAGRLSAEDRQRLMRDPRQRAIIEKMERMPREVASRPIWIGARTGPGRNPLGFSAMMACVAYVGWLVHKFGR